MKLFWLVVVIVAIWLVLRKVESNSSAASGPQAPFATGAIFPQPANDGGAQSLSTTVGLQGPLDSLIDPWVQTTEPGGLSGFKNVFGPFTALSNGGGGLGNGLPALAGGGGFEDGVLKWVTQEYIL